MKIRKITKILNPHLLNTPLKRKQENLKFGKNLQQAKLEMIEKGWHPYLWSSFILIGE